MIYHESFHSSTKNERISFAAHRNFPTDLILFIQIAKILLTVCAPNTLQKASHYDAEGIWFI